MITGRMVVHAEPVKTTHTKWDPDDWQYMGYPHYTTSKSMAELWRELEEAEKKAKGMGFVVGARVKRVGIPECIGIITCFAKTCAEGIDTEDKPNPIGISWDSANPSRYNLFYAQEELILL